MPMEIDAGFKNKRILDGDTLVSTQDFALPLGHRYSGKDQPYGDSATGALANMLDKQRLYLKTIDVDDTVEK